MADFGGFDDGWWGGGEERLLELAWQPVTADLSEALDQLALLSLDAFLASTARRGWVR